MQILCRLDKERQEIEKIHLMNDRQRAHEFETNPRLITNTISGEKQYKFLQKYYHRGSFFLVMSFILIIHCFFT